MNEPTELSHLELNLNDYQQLNLIDDQEFTQDEHEAVKFTCCVIFGIFCVIMFVLLWILGVITFAVLGALVPKNETNIFKIMYHVLLWPGIIIIAYIIKNYSRYCWKHCFRQCCA